jgi:inorganic pyrophosphatase
MRRTLPSLFGFATTLGNSEEATRFTEGWIMNFTDLRDKTQAKSPWHHVSLQVPSMSRSGGSISAGLAFNYVNEIPVGQSEKLEVSTKAAFNPIVQDRVKKTGALRKFNVPGGIPFNYGCFPQTWEDPAHTDGDTKCRGDGDPLDVVELSGAPLAIGSFTPVRVLGVLALIDEGETDWKIIAISEASPLSWKTLQDVPAEVLARVTNWFRLYKTFDGKPENEFAFGGVTQDEATALRVIQECSEQYRSLLAQGANNAHGLWVPK